MKRSKYHLLFVALAVILFLKGPQSFRFVWHRTFSRVNIKSSQSSPIHRNHEIQRLLMSFSPTTTTKFPSITVEERRPQQQHNPPTKVTVPLKIVSFNVLAPCYKRLKETPHSKTTKATNHTESTDPHGTTKSSTPKVYEATYEELYMERNARICDQLLATDADVICLQEFWTGSPALIKLYLQKFCHHHTYSMKMLERTSHWRSRKDGLAIFVKNKNIEIEDVREILFHDCGDRVALMLLLSILPKKIEEEQKGSLGNQKIPPQRFVCVNTHLLFPHNEYSTKIRLREITKILGFVDTYLNKELKPAVGDDPNGAKLPVIICGDFNGSPRGKVYNFVKSQNYQSACENCIVAVNNAKAKADSFFPSWVSHQNHLNSNVFVDHIFYLNPSEQKRTERPIAPDWTNLVYQEFMERIKSKFQGKTMRDVFNSFDQDKSNYITREEFMHAIEQLGFSGEDAPALTKQEIDVLLQSADTNDDGYIDYKEFYDRFWIADEELKSNYGRYHYNDANIIEVANSSPSLSTSTTSTVDGLNTELDSQRFYFARSKFLTTSFQNSTSSSSASSGNQISQKLLADSVPLGDLQVQNLTITPKYLERGEWPQDYQLSDHGMLECIFTAEVQV